MSVAVPDLPAWVPATTLQNEPSTSLFDDRGDIAPPLGSAHSSLLTCPVCFAQAGLQHFTGAGYGQCRNELDAPGTLVTRDQRLAVLANRFRRCIRTGSEHDDGVHALAPLHVG